MDFSAERARDADSSRTLRECTQSGKQKEKREREREEIKDKQKKNPPPKKGTARIEPDKGSVFTENGAGHLVRCTRIFITRQRETLVRREVRGGSVGAA